MKTLTREVLCVAEYESERWIFIFQFQDGVFKMADHDIIDLEKNTKLLTFSSTILNFEKVASKS